MSSTPSTPTPSSSSSTRTPTPKAGISTRWRILAAVAMLGLLGAVTMAVPDGTIKIGLYVIDFFVTFGILATIVLDEVESDWIKTVRSWAFGLAAASILGLGLWVTVGQKVAEDQGLILASDPDLQAQIEAQKQGLLWRLVTGGTPSEAELKDAAEAVDAKTDLKMKTELQTPGSPLATAREAKRTDTNLITLGLKEPPQEKDRFTIFDRFECEWNMGLIHEVGVILKLTLMVVVGVGLLYFLFVVATTWNDPKASVFHKFWVGGGKWGLMATAGLIVGSWIVSESPTQNQCRAAPSVAIIAPAPAPVRHHTSKPTRSTNTSAVAEATRMPYCDNPEIAAKMTGTCGSKK